MKYKDYNIQEIVDFLNQKYHFTYDEVDLVFKTPSLELKDKNLKLNHIIDLRDVDTMVILYQKYKVPFYRCVPDKSHAKHLKLPDIKPELIPDFIRGYYDGDGICYSDGRIGFCGHYDVLLYIYKYINTLLPTPTKTHLNYNKSNNIYYLTYARLSEIQQIVKCIYKDLKDQPFLKRKYKTYRPLLQ